MSSLDNGLISFVDGYIKKIIFANGQILQDFHLNILQDNVSKALKIKTTRERYDLMLMLSKYQMYFSEDFTSTTFRDSSSTAIISDYNYAVSSGNWITAPLFVPPDQKINEFLVLANLEEYNSVGSIVNLYYRTSTSEAFQLIARDFPVFFSSPKAMIQIKFEMIYTSTVRPSIFDFAVLWK